jgi:hypothetical protein
VARVDEQDVAGLEAVEDGPVDLLDRLGEHGDPVVVALPQQPMEPVGERVDEDLRRPAVEEAPDGVEHQPRGEPGADLDQPGRPEMAEHAEQDEAVTVPQEGSG